MDVLSYADRLRKAEEIGKRIRRARQDFGLSQVEAARQMGWLSSQFLSQLEKGSSLPTDATLLRVARVLNVTIEYLRDGKGGPPRPPRTPDTAA
jgi:transcriptional regulator with XRE-family HTH domain